MTSVSPANVSDLPLEEIARAVRQIRFGSVEIVIHDSRVVQIERREKVRFDKTSCATHSGRPHDPTSRVER